MFAFLLRFLKCLLFIHHSPLPSSVLVSFTTLETWTQRNGCFFFKNQAWRQNIFMVILHKLLQENNLFAFNSKKLREKDWRRRKRVLFGDFIYFQLLSMFCRCKGRTILLCGGRAKEHCCFISFLAFYGLLTRFLCLTLPKNLNSRRILWRGFEISFMRGDIKVVNLQYFLWPYTSSCRSLLLAC